MMESQRLVAFVRPAKEKGAFVLGLSDPEERFTVGHALYYELGEVRGGDALSSESVERIRREDERRRARKAALSLLAYADNSRRRLFEKLRRKGISAELICFKVIIIRFVGNVEECVIKYVLKL